MSSPVRKKVLQPPRLLEFKIPCAFNGQMSEVEVYLGNPEAKHNPIFFQNKFISDVKGGMISQGVLDSLEKLKILAAENGVDFIELCKDALTSIATQDQMVLPNQPEEEGEDNLPPDKPEVIDDIKAEKPKEAPTTMKLTEATDPTEIQQNTTSVKTSQEDKPLDEKESKVEAKALDPSISDLVATVVKVAEETDLTTKEAVLEQKPLASPISNKEEVKTEEEFLQRGISDLMTNLSKVADAAEAGLHKAEAEEDSIINPNNEDG